MVTLQDSIRRGNFQDLFSKHRLSESIRHFISSIKSGYPLCCVLEFCIDGFFGKTSHAFYKDAIIKRGKVQDYVSCWIHRKIYFHITHDEVCALKGCLPQKLLNNGTIVTLMPTIICHNCGNNFIHDPTITDTIEACTNCKTQIHIKQSSPFNWKTEQVFPSYKELEPFWDKLTPLVKSRLIEASRCFGCSAYTACESMCFDALCSMLRRIYGGKGELGYYVDKMGKDSDLREFAGAISYFAKIRNRVDHPNGISKRLEAESTFLMTKRLILGIIKKRN